MSSSVQVASETVVAAHKHDCNECDFLGSWGREDLYFCGDSAMPTVIARHSSDGGDYVSGMTLIAYIPALAIAHSLAVQAGLITA